QINDFVTCTVDICLFELRSKTLVFQEEVRPNHELVQSLISTHSTIDAKMASSKVSLFMDSRPLDSEDIERQEFVMPKEERAVDVKTGRVRRKAIFDEEKENHDAVSDEEDDQEEEEMSEDGSDGDDEDDAEEESDREILGEEVVVGSAKRLKREVTKEEAVNELPAFADSDDDLEVSSEGEGKTAPEESDMEGEDSEEQESYENESSDSEFEGVRKGVTKSEQYEINREDEEMRSQISCHNLKKKAVLTTDSGNCTAEEASESEVENSSMEEGGDDEGSHGESEVDALDGKGFRQTREKKMGSVKQTELKAVEDEEDDDVENLLKEEEEYEEKIDFSADTA
ncbi:PREDICTED: ribosome biogenesis protein BMS1 homolog, partial [Tinamus guttatus]|uniref:ribosome biogenesis protein BMS1 homolog n=1 Tax=Tinamus guttatus TaxID=94827 RepID=UPI00052EE085